MRHHLLDLGLTPLGETFRPTSEAYMVSVEMLVEAPLPPDYRAFLGRFGVATFADSVAARLPDQSWVDVHIFLGNDPDDSYDLRQSYLSLREHQGLGLMPFAIDPVGNAFCLTLAEPPVGGVRYLDVGSDAAPWVADDFGSFLGGLRRVP